MVRVSTLWKSAVDKKYSFVVTQGRFPQQILSLFPVSCQNIGHRHTNQVAQGLGVKQKDDHHDCHHQSPHQHTAGQGVRSLYYVEAAILNFYASAQGAGYLQIPGKENRSQTIQLPRPIAYFIVLIYIP